MQKLCLLEMFSESEKEKQHAFNKMGRQMAATKILHFKVKTTLQYQEQSTLFHRHKINCRYNRLPI